MGWRSVIHLGRQFRVQAGLYEDHQLVRTGPYGFVRHPIYTSFMGMLLFTILLITRLEWAPLCLILFIAGTEIRVRTEDKLLASRFGDEFRRYTYADVCEDPRVLLAELRALAYGSTRPRLIA